MYGQTIDINRTLHAVCDVVATAEATIKELIRQYHHDAQEEFITVLLHDYIKCGLQEASEKSLIKHAFLEDLKSALPHHAFSDWNLQRILDWKAEGLVADIILHNRRQEGKTGGDFGLIVVHPRISTTSDSLMIEKGRTSGLLCQAKLKGKNQKWRCLGKSQKAILPAYLDFTSLVLYSYFDQERTQLNPLAWSLCRGTPLSEINELLRKDDFGELLNTRDIIMGLGTERIGTGNQTIIDTVVSPSSRQCFEIRIYWPKDGDPKETTSIRLQQQQAVLQRVYVKQ